LNLFPGLDQRGSDVIRTRGLHEMVHCITRRLPAPPADKDLELGKTGPESLAEMPCVRREPPGGKCSNTHRCRGPRLHKEQRFGHEQVWGDDLNLPAGRIEQLLEHHQAQRVRLIARRAPEDAHRTQGARGVVRGYVRLGR
jgi:hypothetical protein